MNHEKKTNTPSNFSVIYTSFIDVKLNPTIMRLLKIQEMVCLNWVSKIIVFSQPKSTTINNKHDDKEYEYFYAGTINKGTSNPPTCVIFLWQRLNTIIKSDYKYSDKLSRLSSVSEPTDLLRKLAVTDSLRPYPTGRLRRFLNNNLLLTSQEPDLA